MALLVFVAGVAGADQLQLVMPLPLAARVVAGPTWDGAVTVEPRDAGSAQVTVEARFCGGWWERCLRLAGETAPPEEALEVTQRLPLPAELANLGQASFGEKLLRVVVWVSRNVRLLESDNGPQDAVSVWQRRVGRCSGRANLAVALLRQLGVPARVVHGLLVRPGGAVWHRWGEAWLPGAGWRPFDPGATVGVAGIRYLPMTGAEDGLSLAGVRVLSVAEREFFQLPQIAGMRVLLPPYAAAALAFRGGEGL